ncbi:TlpA family protein disulfide reductase [Tenacibaculum sp. TC6]|uniref:TlpA family protein disulfide reductase n=1 Tax=Tenacibaculum sp. TC6 TaxID=3423223 RepID=UPI003D369753
MKYLVVISLLFVSCGVFQPKKFNNLSLQEKLVTIDRDSILFSDIVSNHKGKNTIIQLYASYCPFSQASFKEVKQLQQSNSEINFVFLSVDHSYHDWKRALESLEVKGEHFYIPKKGKGELGKFLKLKTIPRFLLIDKQGNIKVYKTAKVVEVGKKI